MQKILFTLTAITLAGTIASITSQKVEAASVNPAAISKAATNGSVVQVDWEGRRYGGRYWNRRRHRAYGGYRGRGEYGYRRGY